MEMIEVKQAVVWVNPETKQVMVARKGREFGPQGRHAREDWRDPIGAGYGEWESWAKTDPDQCARLMLETAIDLAVDGYDLKTVLREFAKVDCFYALGRESFPMCRALTQVLGGKRLGDPDPGSFDETIRRHA